MSSANEDLDEDELLQIALKKQAERDLNYQKPLKKHVVNLVQRPPPPPSTSANQKRPNPSSNPGSGKPAKKPQPAQVEDNDDSEVELLSISSGDDDVPTNRDGLPQKGRAWSGGGVGLELGLGLELSEFFPPAVAPFPREKKEVIWLYFRTRGDRLLLTRQCDEPIERPKFAENGKSPKPYRRVFSPPPLAGFGRDITGCNTSTRNARRRGIRGRRRRSGRRAQGRLLEWERRMMEVRWERKVVEGGLEREITSPWVRFCYG